MTNQHSEWHYKVYGRGLSQGVPTSSGVYVISRANRVAGFPTDVEPLYVGQAMNLRWRWDQHTDYSEPNPGLFRAGNSYDLEFWWQPVPKEDLNRIEAYLIRTMQPAANRRGKAS